MTGLNIKKLRSPEDEIWTVRRGAMASIHMWISHSRYIHGEVVVETRYRSPEGYEDQDPTSRIWLGDARRNYVTQFYDKLFDAVLIAKGYDVLEVIIDYRGEILGRWDQDFWVVVFIVSYELGVPVAGIIIPETLAYPGRTITLSEDLAVGINAEEDD
jgi:hypothetical protein